MLMPEVRHLTCRISTALQLSSISRVTAPSGVRPQMANRMRIRSGMNAKCKSHLHA